MFGWKPTSSHIPSSKVLLGALLGLLLSDQSWASLHLKVNFEQHEADAPYTREMTKLDFKTQLWGPPENYTGENTKIKNIHGTKALEVLYKAGEYSKAAKFQHHVSEAKPWGRMCFRLFVPQNFDFVNGGKIHGYAGGRDGLASGGNYQQFNGFSTRFMWEKGGLVNAYIYHPFQKQQWGDKFVLKGKLIKSAWNRLCLETKLNTPGKADGWVKVSLNNFRKTYKDFEFRKDLEIGISTFMFSTFFGGGDPSYAPKSDQYLYFDDFTFETGDGPGSGATRLDFGERKRNRKIKRVRIRAMGPPMAP